MVASGTGSLFAPPSGGSNLPIADFFDLLNGKTGPRGRNQVDFTEKDKIREQLARVSGLPPEVFDVRSLNADRQTSRSKSESLGAKDKEQKKAGRAFTDWVFIGRITAEPETHARIVAAMRRMLDGNATIGILIANNPSWAPLAIFCDPSRRREAGAIADYLGFPRSEIAEFSASAPLPQIGSSQATQASSAAPSDAFVETEVLDAILADWRRKKNLILEGPPGVGKTFIIRSLVDLLMGGFDPARFELVQFHQSTSYEDFVRGWRPIDGKEGFEVVDGAFVKFCDAARKDLDRPYVFAIDEINRANLSRVFGELLLLLDHDKRTEDYAVRLAYWTPSKDPTFFVPPNVHVIATMNTADRSLAIFDMAMRRRFAFRKLEPAFGNPKFDELMEARGVDDATRALVQSRFTALNQLIANDTKSLGPGFEIGHSFFCPIEDVASSADWYLAIVTSEIAPLLREYWFDDADLAERYVEALRNVDPDTPTAIELDVEKNAPKSSNKSFGSNEGEGESEEP